MRYANKSSREKEKRDQAERKRCQNGSHSKEDNIATCRRKENDDENVQTPKQSKTIQ